ncbi:10363_t:CDS:2 [Funneliformis mosseae]|uniref:10363_t:CDS:1 n=1 Tax=Funneliformis mosseae TaxID=27381 RepID=A0A9N9A5L4_FUNMO|nr:10363_t:CDS:2 [Funneliformis mosseae]
MNSALFVDNEIYFNENDEPCLKCGDLYSHVEYNEEGNRFNRYDECVALKCLHDSEDINDDFLNEIRYYPIELHDNGVLRCFGISQNPQSKEYIMVLELMIGNLCDWLNSDKNKHNWKEIKDEIIDQLKVYDDYLSKQTTDKQKLHLRSNSQAIYTSRILDFTKPISLMSLDDLDDLKI